MRNTKKSVATSLNYNPIFDLGVSVEVVHPVKVVANQNGVRLKESPELGGKTGVIKSVSKNGYNVQVNGKTVTIPGLALRQAQKKTRSVEPAKSVEPALADRAVFEVGQYTGIVTAAGVQVAGLRITRNEARAAADAIKSVLG